MIKEFKALKRAIHETSVARTQKRWQIRGIRRDGGKLAFPVLAYDHDEARKIAEAKARGGTITDIVLLDPR